MSLEEELKKFELSSAFAINFSWLKRYVESDNGMYTPMKNISDDEFREIENSLYALQATWRAWREAKSQTVLEKDAIIQKLSDQLYAQEMKTSGARVLCETACELLDGYAHQDAMVILNDLEQAMKEPTND